MFFSGPAVSDWEGNMFTAGYLDNIMHDLLEKLLESKPTLFPPDIKTKRILSKAITASSHFTRHPTLVPRKKRVSTADIDTVNQWGKEERLTYNYRPNMPMHQHYVQPELLIEPFLRYTSAM